MIRLAPLGPLEEAFAAESSFGVEDLMGDLGLRARWLLAEGVFRMGRGLAEWIAYGEYRALDLAPFGVDRILRGETFVEKAVI